MLDAPSIAAARSWAVGENDDQLAALLDPSADDAVAEALRDLLPAQADRLRRWRADALDAGLEAARRRLAYRDLAARFAGASARRQRAMLTTDRDALRTTEVRTFLAQSGHPEALALLRLDDLGHGAAALDAREDPGSLATLLFTAATAVDPAALEQAVVLAGDVPIAGFYRAVQRAIDGDTEEACALARGLAGADRRPRLVGTGVLIAQRHPAVLPLLACLVQPPPDR
jgi:hypothetical protein